MASYEDFLDEDDESDCEEDKSPIKKNIGLSHAKKVTCAADSGTLPKQLSSAMANEMPTRTQMNKSSSSSSNSACGCGHLGELEAKNKVIQDLARRLSKESNKGSSNQDSKVNSLQYSKMNQIPQVDSSSLLSTPETSNSTDAEKIASTDQLKLLKQVESLTEELKKSSDQNQELSAKNLQLKQEFETAVQLKDALQKTFDVQSGKYFKCLEETDSLKVENANLKMMMDAERKRVIELEKENEGLLKEIHLTKEKIRSLEKSKSKEEHALINPEDSPFIDATNMSDIEELHDHLVKVMLELNAMNEVVKQQSEMIKKMKTKLQSSAKSSLDSDEQHFAQAIGPPTEKILYKSRSIESPKVASTSPPNPGIDIEGQINDLSSVAWGPQTTNKDMWNVIQDSNSGYESSIDIYTPATQSRVLESLRRGAYSKGQHTKGKGGFDLDEFEASLEKNPEGIVSYQRGPNKRSSDTAMLTNYQQTDVYNRSSHTYPRNSPNPKSQSQTKPRNFSAPQPFTHLRQNHHHQQQQLRQPMEQSDDNDDDATRNQLYICPICNKNQPLGMSQSEFQNHVLDCLGKQDNEQDTRDIHHDEPEDYKCPVCNALFPYTTDMKTFEKHVNGHFDDDVAEDGHFTVIQNDSFGTPQ